MTSLLALMLLLPSQPDTYPPHPDSIRRDGVPEGRMDGPHELRSKVFPGTVRNYWVWVPAGYENRKGPVCQVIVQDGIGKAQQWKIPETLDNLIDDGGMPLAVAIFVDHGKVPPPKDAPEGTQPRFNRSFEYDSMGPRYAEFLLTELLPAVGERYELSDDPSDRMIAGSSSGAIAAFTAAWERPDAFRRVFSAVGTYVGLRGGNEYPTLIRKTEPKPLRVFLQDGSNDLDIYAGGWWTANQSMRAALEFAGYDVKHVWGEGGHNGKHAAAIFPDAMRWLWRDYPEPVAARPFPNRRMDLLIEGEDWLKLPGDYQFTEAPAVGPNGELIFSDNPAGKLYVVRDLEDPKPEVIHEGGHIAGLEMSGSIEGKAFLYATQPRDQRVVRIELIGDDGPGWTLGKEEVLAETTCNDLARVPGGCYITDPKRKTVWWLPDGGELMPATKQVATSNGLTPSTDRGFLWVADSRERHLWHFRIGEDHRLQAGQKYGYVHQPADGVTKSDGMATDTQGQVYVGTALGLQVLDQLGRVHWILPLPNGAPVISVGFAGRDLDTLVATGGGEVFLRKVNATGAKPWVEATAAPKPGL